MELEIKGELVELRFSIGFIRKMDEIYSVDRGGAVVGIGLPMVIEAIESYNLPVLAEVIRASATKRHTIRDIDNALEDYAEENDGLGSLFEKVSDELGNSPMVKDSVKKMKEIAEE